MFSAERLFATHAVSLSRTWGKYCASFCVSGKRMKVKSGALTWATPRDEKDKIATNHPKNRPEPIKDDKTRHYFGLVTHAIGCNKLPLTRIFIGVKRPKQLRNLSTVWRFVRHT